MRVYPDLVARRLAWIAGDLGVAAWVMTWALVGWVVGLAVLQLDVLAQAVINTGTTFNGWIGAFERAVPTGVPLLSDLLRHQAELLKQQSGDPLIALGRQSSSEIHNLALILGLVVAVAPVAPMLFAYLPGRIRRARDLWSADHIAQLGMAGAELNAATLEVLALRALCTLPYHRLLRYSANPAADFGQRRFEALARAELEREGLSLARYRGRAAGA